MVLFVDFQVPSWVSCFKENSLPPVLPRFLSQSPRFSPGTLCKWIPKAPGSPPVLFPNAPGSFGRPRFSPVPPRFSPVPPQFSPGSPHTLRQPRKLVPNRTHDQSKPYLETIDWVLNSLALFLAGNCAEKPILQVPIWRAAVRISAETEGKSQKISGWRKRGVEFKGGSLHDGFGSFDGFGGSGEHLALLLLALQKTGQRGNRNGFDGFGGYGGCGGFGRDGYPP